MIQSSQPVWSRRDEPNLSESSLAGGVADHWTKDNWSRIIGRNIIGE